MSAIKKGDLVEYYDGEGWCDPDWGLTTSQPYFKLGYNHEMIDVLWEGGRHDWVSVEFLRPVQQ